MVTYSVAGRGRIGNVFEILGALQKILEVDRVDDRFLSINCLARHIVCLTTH